MSTVTLFIALVALGVVALVATLVSEHRTLPAAREDEHLDFGPSNPWAGKYVGSHRR